MTVSLHPIDIIVRGGPATLGSSSTGKCEHRADDFADVALHGFCCYD